MCLGSSEKALNVLGYETLEKKRENHVRNLVMNSLCTTLIITKMYYLEQQEAAVHLDFCL